MSALAFANPALLPLLALAAGPVVLHMVMRRRPRLFDFPTLRFLRRASTETRRARRPRDIVVLVLRTLFILALAAAFTRPQAFVSPELLRSAGGARDAVLVVDRSLSMGFNERGLSRFAAASARAREVLDSLPAGSRADVVWLDAGCEPVFGAVSENLPALRAELAGAEPGFSAAAPAAALARAAAILERSAAAGASGGSGLPRPREIYVISDFQASNWDGVDQREAAGGARVFDVLIGEDPRPANVDVARLAASPERPVAGERCTVTAEVANRSAAAVERSVVLEIGESRQERRLTLPAGSRATAEFEIVPRESGRLELSAVIGEDALPADNRRFLVLQVSAAVSVGLVAASGAAPVGGRDGGAPDGERFLRAALEAPPTFVSVHSLPAADWAGRSAEPAESIFLCGWPGADAAGFAGAASLLAAGKTLVWVLPEQGEARLAPDALPGFRAEIGPVVTGGEGAPGRLRPAATDDPLLAIFRGGDAGDLSSVAFRRHRRLSVEGGRTVLAYDDGSAALVRAEHPKGGTLFIWNLPLSAAGGDLAGSNFLLPLVREIVRQNRGAAAPLSVLAGTPASIAVPLSADPAGLRIEAPGGAAAPFRIVPGAASARLEVDRVERPGICRVRDGAREIAALAVNVPESESDLRQLSGEALEKAGALAVGAEESVRGLREGTPLWPALLALALLALAAENLVLGLWKTEN